MNSVFLDLGFVTIYWYSVMIFIAFLIGGAMALKEAYKWNISEDFMINLFFYLIPISLLGARLYYVLFNLDYYSNNIVGIFKVWEGGLAIHGGIIAGLLFIIFYTKKYGVNTIRVLDILVVSLILGQAIGRWGNFFNGEAHGPITTLETLQAWHLPEFIIDGMYINGNYYVPTFLIESIWCFIGFIVLFLFRSSRYIKLGQTTCLYLILYGGERFLLEILRTDSLMIGSIKVAMVVSLLMFVIGLIFFLKLRKGSLFANKYNDKANTNATNF